MVAKLAVRSSLAILARERAHVHRCDAEPHEEVYLAGGGWLLRRVEVEVVESDNNKIVTQLYGVKGGLVEA